MLYKHPINCFSLVRELVQRASGSPDLCDRSQPGKIRSAAPEVPIDAVPPG